MKKAFSLFLALVCLGAIAFSKQQVSAADAILNIKGYPIVKKKITLKVVSVAGSWQKNFTEMDYFKKLEAKTDIHLEVQTITQDAPTKINLMFASQDYPDLMFNGASDKNILMAAESGDIIPLDNLIKKYSPNWKKYFSSNPYAKKVATMPDGKIWSLPIIRDEASNYGIRDQWLINVQWLKELGLSTPKTTDDFYKVLKAFKDNAGKGTIPKNVIPWMFRFNNYGNGGQYELYNAFGVFTPGNTNYVSVDKKGKIYFSAIDPKIKEPIKYLHMLYKEGLIPAEIFTDNQTASDAKCLSNPPMVGSYGKYFNDDITEKVYAPMPALTSPQNSKPQYRMQTNTVTRNYFTIFKKNRYPEASMRLADTIADSDWSVQGMYGMYGKWLEKKGDKIIQKPFNGNEIYEDVPANRVSLMLTPKIFNNFVYNGSQATRDATIKKVYQKDVAPLKRYFPPVVWKSEEQDQLNNIQTDLLDYINKTIAHWIVYGGIDNEWDAYIKKTNALKVKELIKIYQNKLAQFNKK